MQRERVNQFEVSRSTERVTVEANHWDAKDLPGHEKHEAKADGPGEAWRRA